MAETFALNSTNLAGGAYDPATRELTIEFASGGRYVYSGVAPEVVAELRSAGSPGKFFYAAIRNNYSVRQEA